ncbi:MAG: hypothetical protein HMLKMBBP_02198 [Planctomycetes bacterium]|nr:hypothetical protein [Planctomycetota bacterium]
MTVVFAQGMRRSGTTILFDLMWDDGRFDCWYEPLNAVRPARGGGSKAREVDYAEKVEEAKRRFLAARGDPSLGPGDLNWGAPRAPHLEFEPSWPPHVRDFVASLAASAPRVFVKFTRASHKLADLAAIRPDAWFVHVVRDPRAVATSHLFRTDPAVKERVLREGSFFTLATGFDQWKTETMAAHLVATRPDLARFAAEPAFVRAMLVWRELYTATRDGARAHFPGRHAVVWHDALCADPCGTLRALFARWGMQPEERVLEWARANVRPAKPWHGPERAEWSRAADLLGLAPLVAEARDGHVG